MRLDDLFVIVNGIQANTIPVHEKTAQNRVAFLRPSKRFRGTILGYVDISHIPERQLFPANTIFVSTDGDGSHTYSYVSPFEFSCNSNVVGLLPKKPLTLAQKIYYAQCITGNRWLFSYGRKPKGDRLGAIQLPPPEKLPHWVSQAQLDETIGKDAPTIKSKVPDLFGSKRPWRSFTFDTLFELKKGRRLTKANMSSGNTPFIGAVDNNNGLTAFVGQEASHPANTMTVNYNGNGVAEAFYQPVPYRCSDDVNVLYPRFRLTPSIALFIATVIRQEKYRFSYGRKWHLERMRNSTIGLPVDKKGSPDWAFMEQYINTLPFSSQLE